MINIKFKKQGNAAFISHTDVLRSTNRTLRRANINVEYSKGFNPHMLLNLSQPLPLGIASLAEWVTIQTEVDNIEKFIESYNMNCPSGFEAVEGYITKTAPNIAGKVIASDYFITSEKAIKIKEQIENLKNSPYVLDYLSSGKQVQKEVSGLVYGIDVTAEGIKLRLAFGNKNLRIDKLFQQFNKDFSLDIEYSDIIRLNQFIEQDGKFIEVGDYLKSVE